jgi:hypothetical protein
MNAAKGKSLFFAKKVLRLLFDEKNASSMLNHLDQFAGSSARPTNIWREHENW